MSIGPIGSHSEIAKALQAAAPRSASNGPGFAGVLGDVTRQVNEAGLNAEKAVADAVQGKADSLHGVMMAVNKADLSFRFLMQTRNKLVGAYNEIMKMQL